MKSRKKIIDSLSTLEEYKSGLYTQQTLHRVIDACIAHVVREQKSNCAVVAVMNMDKLRHPSTGSAEIKDIILEAKNAGLE